MAGATWFMHSEFTKLESGEIDSMEVWAPIAALYNLAGMWGGLSVFILFGGVSAAWGIKQLVSGNE